MSAATDAHGGMPTIPQALAFWAARTPHAVALLAPGREAVTYRDLFQAVERLAGQLRARGLGRQDGIALLIPDGLDLCVGVLAAIAAGIAVPLAAPGPVSEHLQILTNPRVRALLIPSGGETPLPDPRGEVSALRLCRGAHGRVAELAIAGPALGEPVALRGPNLEEVALILRSSGTTGRPKLAPRTHRNVQAFCQAVAAARTATPRERCLSVARTVYSQGINALLFTIFSGASLVLLEHGDEAALADALRTCHPTYVTTTPAIVRVLAASDSELHAALAASPVNRIHASAGPLGATERESLEQTLGVPIISGYGLTEASGLAGETFPRPRLVAGSVGLPWCDIRVVDERGAFLGREQVGEVVARGPQVFPGYLDDAETNAAAFLPGGWFRTGDLGLLDDGGYLHLTGRVKEIVNRGGESIAPDEIDDVLRGHPAVAEAAVFAVPDALLGEDLVAAIVLKRDRHASPREVRGWLLDRLRPSKVPRRIWFVSELPRTATGKVRRSELARRWSEDQP